MRCLQVVPFAGTRGADRSTGFGSPFAPLREQERVSSFLPQFRLRRKDTGLTILHMWKQAYWKRFLKKNESLPTIHE
jgi:hypothetical protein